jgi:transposase
MILKRSANSLTLTLAWVYKLVIFVERSGMSKEKKPAMMLSSDVAELFGVNIKTVNDWIHAGKFPGAYKIADYRTAPYLIPSAEVEAFKKERDQSSN